MIYGIIITIIAIIFIYIAFNLLKKNEKQEELNLDQMAILMSYNTYLNQIADIIEYADKKMLEVDARGHYKSDDEVGFFFEQIKLIQGKLNEFKKKEL